MTTEAWIFLVGFRLLDVGLLVLFLIWFFRLRDDGDDADDDGPGGGGGGDTPPERGGPGGGGLRVPLRDVRPGRRIRDHAPRVRRPRRRGAEQPVPRPLPARVRRPAAPTPAHRRTRAV
jgi:hypothetical protein